MTTWRILLGKELREHRRTMRLAILLVVYAVFGIASPLLAKVTPDLLAALLPASQLPETLPEPTAADAIAQFVKNVGGTLTLAAILLAMGSIVREKETGTAGFLFARGVGRGPFVAAKLVALGLLLAAALTASGLLAYGYTALLFGAPDLGAFALLVLLCWASQLAIAAVTLLGSALASSTVGAAAIGIVVYVALSLLAALPTVGPWTPAGLQASGAAIASGAGGADLAGPLLATVGVIAGSTIAAWAVLRRQEV